jgi:hypothetical protein
MLSLRHKFLFVHIKKTAGNAIQSALLPFSEDRVVLTGPSHDGVERFNIQSPTADIRKHSRLAEYRSQLPEELFRELFKFTCVRNPWDRCVSFYFSPHRREREWSPEVFVDLVRRVVEPAHLIVELEKGEGEAAFDNLDDVIRFERLEADFRRVCRTLALPVRELPKINLSKRGDYREYYETDEMIELVADKFAPEITRFGYRFE